MKPIGPILKKYIEENGMVKGEIAERIGITYNYLSTIFKKDTIDATLLEKICVAVGLNPMTFFDCDAASPCVNYSDIKASANIGAAAVNISHNDSHNKALLAERDKLIEEKNRLIEEKERTIQILLTANGLKSEAGLGHSDIKR